MVLNQRLLSICFFLTSYILIAQQGHLKGSVIFDNNEPVLGAHIVLTGNDLKHETISDINGEYLFKNIPYGNYNIQMHSLNAKSHSINVVHDATDKTHHATLEITEFHDLEEVLVQTQSTKSKIENEGFSVNVVETKEASLRNIQTNELLNTTVGVKLRQNGGLGSQVQYSLNGLSGGAVRIFIDGIPISVYGSSFNLNSIPPSMIKRIEVYKGVVPGHLADDALGGAINIVLQNSTRTNFNASVSYGSFNTLQTSANGLYRFDKSGFTVKASGFYNYSDNDYKVWGGQVKHIEVDGSQIPITARRFNDAYKSTGGMMEFGFTNVKWADQFFIGITGSDDYKEVQHGAFMTIHPYKGRFLESDALLTNFNYQKKDLFVQGLDFNTNGLIGERNRIVNDTTAYAYTWLGVRQQRPVDFSDPYGESIDLENSWGSQQEGGPTLLNINRKVASIRSGINYEINNHHKLLLNHIYSGVDREDHDEMVSLLENTFRQTSNLHKNIFSLSYELNAFDDKLKFNLFGKHYRQKVERIRPEFNDDRTEVIEDIYTSNKHYNGFGFASSYALFQNFTVLASAERAIRLPNETEVFGDAGDNVVENPSIKPEISNNINLGFRFGEFNFNNHKLLVTTNLFSRKIQDIIGLPPSAGDRWENDELVQYDNFNEETTSQGIEFQLNYTYKNNFGFNFNLSRLTLEFENQYGNITDVPNTPLFTMNGALRYSINNFIQEKGRLNLFYNAYFTDEFSYIIVYGNTIDDGRNLVPTQFINDFGLSYSFPKENFVLSFDVKNIFDQAAYDNRSVQKPGRAFYLKLNYIFNKL
ncbi:TonB-dependent receptor [Formosa sp. A9]|uniref:TonB-dependent receptor n=1 Tax=Formosa sp. A9 TaxID=3442641 RepID=UPI003EBE2A50